MRLLRYRVTNFRSVEDSGWVEADGVTALIGVNESGKTNLVLPLWKLNPAREGEIHPNSDYPKKKFGEIREKPGAYCFVDAEFATGEEANKIAEKAGITAEAAGKVQVKRWFDGHYTLWFPDHARETSAPSSEVRGIVQKALDDIQSLEALKQEETLKESIVAALNAIIGDLNDDRVGGDSFSKHYGRLKPLVPESPAKTSVIVPRLQQCMEAIAVVWRRVTAKAPESGEGVVDFVVSVLPKFVYYSNYGNLDSEIYLPHVVQNLQRTDLGAKDAAKARTLRVLFKFVRLEADEIMELGQDFKDPNREPTPEEISAIAEKKRERSILLQSAGASLTESFRDWWKQGDYRFRFEADGNHFRIWVSDDRRPEEVELESRSTGLQWFLSFYLVFLVESLGEHKDAILLLDEPGLSLHPLAQRQLSAFFEGLMGTNQILYTTHSPFLVDADRLERARKVYISANGTTKITPDLRYGDADPRQAGAAYAVHSALNLSVAESLLVGCQPVIVEGPSDQHYLTAMKSLLISGSKISPRRELVFPPSGGTKTARAVASILTGRDETLPMMLLDSDEAGTRMARELRSALYVDAKERILLTDDFVPYKTSEIEDLFPAEFFAEVVDRSERNSEVPFRDVVQAGKPLVDQVTKWAASQGIELVEGWKVEVAKRAKQLALSRGLDSFPPDRIEAWTKLFQSFIAGQ